MFIHKTLKHIDEWDKLNETKEKIQKFYINLNLEDITDLDYNMQKEFVKILKQNIYLNITIYILKAIHYYYLADVFENSTKMC